MEANVYTLTFPAFIGLLGLVAWMLVQRQIKRADDDAAKREASIDAKFKDHEVRMNQHGDRLREAEIALAGKTSREELEKVTEKFTASVENLRNEMRADIQELRTSVLTAISNHKP
jgi:hypothetical protein